VSLNRQKDCAAGHPDCRPVHLTQRTSELPRWSRTWHEDMQVLFVNPPPQSGCFTRWRCPSVCLFVRLSDVNAYCSGTGPAAR